MPENISTVEMGNLIGKYLRATGRIPEMLLHYTDEEIGKVVFYDPCQCKIGSVIDQGSLAGFLSLYYEAQEYYTGTV